MKFHTIFLILLLIPPVYALEVDFGQISENYMIVYDPTIYSNEDPATSEIRQTIWKLGDKKRFEQDDITSVTFSYNEGDFICSFPNGDYSCQSSSVGVRWDEFTDPPYYFSSYLDFAQIPTRNIAGIDAKCYSYTVNQGDVFSYEYICLHTQYNIVLEQGLNQGSYGLSPSMVATSLSLGSVDPTLFPDISVLNPPPFNFGDSSNNQDSGPTEQVSDSNNEVVDDNSNIIEENMDSSNLEIPKPKKSFFSKIIGFFKSIFS